MLTARLIKFAESKGINVTVKELSGDIQGVSTGGAILLSPDAGIKTLLHELAHELMHQNGDRSKDKIIPELEAESVAYVVAKHFGLDGLSSPNYIALHKADAEMIMEHLERIRDISTQIINSIRISPDI